MYIGLSNKYKRKKNNYYIKAAEGKRRMEERMVR